MTVPRSGHAKRAPLAAALMLALVTAGTSGCVEGEPRFFEDESAQVTRIKVNAFAAEDSDVARVEIRGLDAQGTHYAFTGQVNVTIEAQDRSTAEHTYSLVYRGVANLTPDMFSTPTVPYATLDVPATALPGAGTYRVWGNATIGERTVVGEPALFEWVPAA